LMPVLAALALTAGCSDLQDDAMLAQAAATETAYVNGRIYTQDEDRPWAESLVTKGDRIVFVGSDEEALEHAAEDARLVDLQNRFVMPGMVDAHTHPGLIATGANVSVLDETDEADEEPANADRMPSRPREATLAWLQRQRSDDLFMFFKRPIAGLSPGGRYIVTVSVEI
jgi:predicted amidohydrolase YtcJ